jgi:hypothetical protein
MPEKEPKSSSNIVWVVLAGFLGLFALGNQKPSGESSASPADAGSKEEKSAARRLVDYGGGPLEPLDSFFSTRKERKHPFTNRDQEQLSQFEREYLILTIPDPVDSQFGFLFDQLMDATERALESQRYVLDRAWLPWELDKQKAASARIVVNRQELADVLFPRGDAEEAQPRVANYREENPGTMLFRRRSGASSSLCIVFVVGENPTSGIDKRAFAAAIELTQKYPAAKAAKTIRVVGPSFTGSQTSMQMVLHDALHDARHHDLTFEIISGAALGVDPSYLCQGGGGRIHFSATVIPSKHVISTVLHYLKHREKSRSFATIDPTPPAEVALLVESNTSFGQVNQEVAQENQGIGPVNRPESKPHPEPPKVIAFPFPLHISRLRSSYEEERRRKEEKLNLPASDSLVPPLRTKAADRDSIPSQDPATTSSINGGVLKDILSLITRRGIRYVGIIATDPRDQIMLASSVREHCPGVQIFFTGGDMFFTLPEYNYSLKGAIVGSTYPLIPENQYWTDPYQQKKRLCFPSEGAQGTYNAILAQMGEAGRKDMIEYHPPRFRGVADSQEELRKPPVWITMIGQNGELVPLQYFTHLSDEAERYVWPPQAVKPAPPADQRDIAFPATVLIVLIAIVVLCLLVVWYALSKPGPLLFWATEGQTEGLPWLEQLAYRLVCLGSLICLLLPFIELCWIADTTLNWEEEGGTLKKVLHEVPVGVLFLLALALFSPLPRRWSARLPAGDIHARRMGWLLYGLAVVLVFAAVVGMWHKRCVGEALTSWQALYFERSLSVTTGVSPLLPWVFVCLTFFFWSFYQLRRCFFAERFSVPNPYPLASPPHFNFADINTLDQSLRGEVRSSLIFLRQHPIDVAVILAIVALGATRVGELYLPTAEGPLWSWLLFFAFAAGFFLIALNLVRFLVVWWRLKKLLSEIALVPMMRAFDQLPAKLVTAFGGYLSPRRLRLSQLHIPLHQLGLLRAETARLLKKPLVADPEVQSRVNELRAIHSHLASYSERDLDSPSPGVSEAQRVNALSKRFGKVTRRLLSFLPTFWPRHSFQEAFGGNTIEAKPATAKSGKTSSVPGMGVFQLWVQLAEDLVAIQVVIYLSQFFLQLRNVAWSQIVCGTLLLLGVTSYPFQPERLILLLWLVLVGAVIGSVIYVLVRMNQDELLSRISRTTPNRFTFDWGFASSLLTYVVPMVGIVLIQMSGAFRFMLEPLVRVLR